MPAGLPSDLLGNLVNKVQPVLRRQAEYFLLITCKYQITVLRIRQINLECVAFNLLKAIYRCSNPIQNILPRSTSLMSFRNQKNVIYIPSVIEWFQTILNLFIKLVKEYVREDFRS